MELPVEFLDKMHDLLGEEYPSFLASYEDERLYGLRVNNLKISCEEFEKICPFKITKIPWVPNGYFYEAGVSPAKHPYYHAGLYYLQEPSAMTPASRLDIKPGEAVLDLCAAPGGKATELGVKLQGQGVLVANDISSSRAKALLKNIELFGIRNPFIVNESPIRLAEKFEQFFDKILMDAPCSGEGMFRKETSVIKGYLINGVDFYANIQKEIIGPVIDMLKPGGQLLYSTCTFSPEEDEEIIDYILDHNPELHLVDIAPYEGFSKGRPDWASGREELQKCIRIWPHKMCGEGHFVALLQKDGDLPYIKKERKRKAPTGLEYFYDFIKGLSWKFEPERLELQGERLFYMTERLGEQKGMRFLRNGLFLGECLNKRFEPSQALAMAILPGEFAASISLPAEDERVRRYLKGETISVEQSEGAVKGWNLFCVDGFPLGWGKWANGNLKNKYYPGWRLM